MRTIDITTTVTTDLFAQARKNERMAFYGHVGTHFDVMNKVFPLEYMEREGIVFDVSAFGTEREITLTDSELAQVHAGMFVAFRTGFIEKEGYATSTYFREHPQLSFDLIHALLDRKVSIIGVDFAGVRRGKEHTPTDQLCADQGVFIVENLCNLAEVLHGKSVATFQAGTYPIKFEGQTGLPCRVVARGDQ